MERITFSSDEGNVSREDELEIVKLINQFFHTEEDPEQMPATPENARWITANIPECRNAVKANGKIIGVVFVMPCTQQLMRKFVEKKINERVLSEEIKKRVSYKNFDAIYLCSAFIHPNYRKRGLALQACVKVVKRVWKLGTKKPTLFYWGYSAEGKQLAQKVAIATGLEIFERKD